MNHPPRRRQADVTMNRIADTLINGELHLAATLMGAGMILWGSVGLWVRPEDLERFAQDFMFHHPILWGVHSIVCGMVFIGLAARDFPSQWSLFFGLYGTVIYTWIAMARPVSSFTSGVTLNVFVILMSALCVHRSGRK